jgi:hypothetical protein
MQEDQVVLCDRCCQGEAQEQHMLKDIVCMSVAGGWQSASNGTNITFGPVFKKCSDLLDWQAENIHSVELETFTIDADNE